MLNHWLNSSWWGLGRWILKTAAWSSGYPVLMMANQHSLSTLLSFISELHRTAPWEKEQFNDCSYPLAETKQDISKLLWNLSGNLFTTPGSNEGSRFTLKTQRRNTSRKRSLNPRQWCWWTLEETHGRPEDCSSQADLDNYGSQRGEEWVRTRRRTLWCCSHWLKSRLFACIWPRGLIRNKSTLSWH